MRIMLVVFFIASSLSHACNSSRGIMPVDSFGYIYDEDMSEELKSFVLFFPKENEGHNLYILDIDVKGIFQARMTLDNSWQYPNHYSSDISVRPQDIDKVEFHAHYLKVYPDGKVGSCGPSFKYTLERLLTAPIPDPKEGPPPPRG
ncbi:hypothetical protein [Pseudoalteromonas sp. T1lg22]|uniref:hypothetical protein n=1 Tax=Pseudoalteromonas sp. T1lg22 TaxID=2077096 RepID=UPI00131A24E0|nr:hypothetical protein [Pseudoalteromonas sp. T1lg22]